MSTHSAGKKLLQYVQTVHTIINDMPMAHFDLHDQIHTSRTRLREKLSGYLQRNNQIIMNLTPPGSLSGKSPLLWKRKTKKVPTDESIGTFRKEAVRTRLELATPCVTGRYSNQLNYRTNISKHSVAPELRVQI